jgi:hypothetical protein
LNMASPSIMINTTANPANSNLVSATAVNFKHQSPGPHPFPQSDPFSHFGVRVHIERCRRHEQRHLLRADLVQSSPSWERWRPAGSLRCDRQSNPRRDVSAPRAGNPVQCEHRRWPASFQLASSVKFAFICP